MFAIILSILFVAEDTLKTYRLEEIVVTATKIEEEKEKIGKSVTIITEEDIKKEGATTLLEVLRNLPGMDVVQTGAFGGLTSIYLRGCKPGHTLILIDGIEVNDPISIDRSFDFANIPTTAIEKIEIIRGPQSALYGSDAVAGVINIITKKGKKGVKFNIDGEVGSYKTYGGNIGINGGTNIFDYSFSISNQNTEGISKVIGEKFDKDGYKNISGYGKINLHYNTLDANLFGSAHKANTDLDDGYPFLDSPDDTNYTCFSNQWNLGMIMSHKTTPYCENKVTFAINKINRGDKDINDRTPDSLEMEDESTGECRKFEYQNNFLLKNFNIISGFEYEKEIGESFYYSAPSEWWPYPTWDTLHKKLIENKSLYIEFEPSFYNIFLNFGNRMDLHKLYGYHYTNQISIAYIFEKTKLKANYGKGFKSPTIFQLYSPYGDSTLNPELSESYDIGIEQKISSASIEIVHFNNKFSDEIIFDYATFKYKNLGKGKTKGVEFIASISPIENIKFDLAYTNQKTEDENGEEYLRRPHNKYRVGTYFIHKNFELNAKTIYVGKRYDMDFTVYPCKRIILPPYTKTDLVASIKIKNIKLTAKIENLFDKAYEEVYGYSTPRRSFYFSSSLAI